MATFWAILIGALFVIAVGVLVFLGARYLRMQKHAHEGEKMPSSRDKTDRDRRESQMNPDRTNTGPSQAGGRTRVYRH